MILTWWRRFLALESAAGIVLALAALAALLISNSPLQGHYESVLRTVGGPTMVAHDPQHGLGIRHVARLHRLRRSPGLRQVRVDRQVDLDVHLLLGALTLAFAMVLRERGAA